MLDWASKGALAEQRPFYVLADWVPGGGQAAWLRCLSVGGAFTGIFLAVGKALAQLRRASRGPEATQQSAHRASCRLRQPPPGCWRPLPAGRQPLAGLFSWCQMKGTSLSVVLALSHLPVTEAGEGPAGKGSQDPRLFRCHSSLPLSLLACQSCSNIQACLRIST